MKGWIFSSTIGRVTALSYCLCVVFAGAAGVFTDLKTAASAVIRSAGKETSRTVGYKYGEDAEKMADDTLVATGHTVNIVSVRNMLI